MTDLPPSAGQTLMLGIRGPELDRETASRLRALMPAGLILFRRNLESPSQVARLLDEVRRLLPYPLLLALDQEGGRVSRLEPWVGPTPTAAGLAREGREPTRRFARSTGRALRALGFNVDFAPVVDLCDPDADNGIADRSFGCDPDTAAEMAGAFLDGLNDAGVAGCIKHFPGLGPTSVDSHLELPTADRSSDGFRRLDLAPYRVLGDRAPAVMVGHAHYPELDPSPGRPATLSPPIVHDLLRGELGYTGLIVSDDLEMGAVAPLDRDGAAAVQSMAAGCDLLLYCADLDRAERAASALDAAARTDDAIRRRLREAATAIRRVAVGWPVRTGDLDAWETSRRQLTKDSAIGPRRPGPLR